LAERRTGGDGALQMQGRRGRFKHCRIRTGRCNQYEDIAEHTQKLDETIVGEQITADTTKINQLRKMTK
jgi:hypothetical protein